MPGDQRSEKEGAGGKTKGVRTSQHSHRTQQKQQKDEALPQSRVEQVAESKKGSAEGGKDRDCKTAVLCGTRHVFLSIGDHTILPCGFKQRSVRSKRD